MGWAREGARFELNVLYNDQLDGQNVLVHYTTLNSATDRNHRVADYLYMLYCVPEYY